MNTRSSTKKLFELYVIYESNKNHLPLEEGFMDFVKGFGKGAGRELHKDFVQPFKGIAKKSKNFLRNLTSAGPSLAVKVGDTALGSMGTGGLASAAMAPLRVASDAIRAKQDASPETDPAKEGLKATGRAAIGFGRGKILSGLGAKLGSVVGPVGTMAGGLIGAAASPLYRAVRRGLSSGLKASPTTRNFVNDLNNLGPVKNFKDRVDTLMGAKDIKPLEAHPDTGISQEAYKKKTREINRREFGVPKGKSLRKVVSSKIAASTEINYDNGSYILKERSVMDNHIDARLALKLIFESVLQQELINETKRANKEKMAGILRKKADWEESGDEFKKAKNLRTMATARDPGMKGGTGPDSPEAKQKRDARKQGTGNILDRRTPQEVADDAKKARQRPDPNDPDAGVKNQARQSRLRHAASAKAKREGKPDPHAPRGGSRRRGGAMGSWVYKSGVRGGRGGWREWDEPDDE